MDCNTEQTCNTPRWSIDADRGQPNATRTDATIGEGRFSGDLLAAARTGNRCLRDSDSLELFQGIGAAPQSAIVRHTKLK